MAREEGGGGEMLIRQRVALGVGVTRPLLQNTPLYVIGPTMKNGPFLWPAFSMCPCVNYII